jgi:hypothetical protein
MNSDTVLRWCLRETQDLLREPCFPRGEAFDRGVILRLRKLLSLSIVREALRASDTFLAFAVRRVLGIITDDRRTEREMIDALTSVLGDRELVRACRSHPMPRV